MKIIHKYIHHTVYEMPHKYNTLNFFQSYQPGLHSDDVDVDRVAVVGEDSLVVEVVD